MSEPRKTSEWRRNWRLVAAGSAGMFVTIMPTSTVGVFIGPLEAEFGWSRTAITSAAAMSMMIAAFLSARYFAIDHFPRLYAWTFAGNRIAGGIGPMAIALMFDLKGSYMFALVGAAILMGLSGLLIFTLDGLGGGRRQEAGGRRQEATVV